MRRFTSKRRRIEPRPDVCRVTRLCEIFAKHAEVYRSGVPYLVSAYAKQLCKCKCHIGTYHSVYDKSDFDTASEFGAFAMKHFILKSLCHLAMCQHFEYKFGRTNTKSCNYLGLEGLVSCQLIATLRIICSEYDPGCRKYCAHLSKDTMAAMVCARLRGKAWVPAKRSNESEMLYNDPSFFCQANVVMSNVGVPQELVQLILAYYSESDRTLLESFGYCSYACYKNVFLAWKVLSLSETNVRLIPRPLIRCTKTLILGWKNIQKTNMLYILKTLTDQAILCRCMVKKLVIYPRNLWVIDSSRYRGLPKTPLSTVRILELRALNASNELFCPYKITLNLLPEVRHVICEPRLSCFDTVHRKLDTISFRHSQRIGVDLRVVPELIKYVPRLRSLYGVNISNMPPLQVNRCISELGAANLEQLEIIAQDLNAHDDWLRTIDTDYVNQSFLCQLSQCLGSTLKLLYICGGKFRYCIPRCIYDFQVLEQIICGACPFPSKPASAYSTCDFGFDILTPTTDHPLHTIGLHRHMYIHIEANYMFAYLTKGFRVSIHTAFLVNAIKGNRFKFIICHSLEASEYGQYGVTLRRPELQCDKRVILIDESFDLDQFQNWNTPTRRDWHSSYYCYEKDINVDYMPQPEECI